MFIGKCRAQVLQQKKSAVMQMPKVIFIPCARSHRFERREIEVFEEVKVRRFRLVGL